MEFLVLGPLEVRLADRTIEIRRGIPRVLLCVLLVSRGDTVSFDALIERLWGDDLPANPANALQTQVAYLRRALGGAGAAPIVTRPTGYALDVEADAVDAYRFERLVEDARRLHQSGTAASLAATIETLDAGLRLWRGPALADVADRPFAQGEATRLDELRLHAVERRIDALLDLGRAAEAAADLGGLVVDHPLRERFHEQLVIALYRAGRQADALRAYENARRTLADELGIDPGPDLRRLERLVLDQSPELTWSPPAGSGAAPGEGDSDAEAAVADSTVPAPASPLIGRGDELARTTELLASARLLTLTGPGGGGKTRLALELAAQASTTRAVHFADLAAVHTDDAVAATVAAVIGVEVPVGEDASAAVAEALSVSGALVLLDTCEHVISGAAGLAEAVVAGCPGVTILATSRRPLGATGELAWPVPPLRLPAMGEDPGASPSVQLFVERARAVAPELELDDATVADIGRLCRSLDGLPLAIELAAAQADVLPPSAILAHLADDLAVLVGTDTGAARQRTLQATIQWSVDLLDDGERDLLGRLGAFVGTFDLDAVGAVAGCDSGVAFKRLASLVRSSLVARAGEDRYRLLDTVRAFIRANLDGSLADAHQRHARHFADVAAVASVNVRSASQQAWIRRARADLGNFHAALDWCFGPEGDEHVGAELVAAIAWVWTIDGLLVGARRALERAAEVRDADPLVRSGVMLGIGLLAAPLGDLVTARDACTESAELARSAGSDRQVADALISLGVAHWGLGDLDEAARVHDESIELFERVGEKWGASVARILRARTALDRDDALTAAHLLDIALEDARAIGDAHIIGLAFEQHANLALRAGDLEKASVAARECLAHNEAISYAEGIVAGVNLLARIYGQQGDRPAARALHLRALDTAARIRHAGGVCEALEAIAALEAAAGDDERAAMLLLHAERARERRNLPLRGSMAGEVGELRRSVHERLGTRWDAIERLVPLTSLDAVVNDVLAGS